MSQGENLPARHTRDVQRQYWVDAANGSNGTAETTARDNPNAPWQTINHAITTSVLPAAGDTAINVRNTGIYQEAAPTTATMLVEKTGLTSSKRLIIRKDQVGKPIIRMTSGSTGAQHDCIQILSSYTIVDGFECDSTGRPGPSSGSNDGTGIYINMTGSPDGAVECWNLDIHDLVMASNTSAKAQGVFSEPASPINPIQFINIKTWNIGPTAEGESANNLEHGYYLHGNCWLINCLAYDVYNGFALQIYNGGTAVDKIYTVHSTLAFTTDMGLITVDPRNSTNIEFRNSIFYAAPSGTYNIANTQGTAPAPGGAGNIDHLINKPVDGLGAIANAADFTITNHDTSSDPGFVNSAGRNFKLLASSPARGYVDNRWSPSFDIENKTRPTGSEDAGAYQFVDEGFRLVRSGVFM